MQIGTGTFTPLGGRQLPPPLKEDLARIAEQDYVDNGIPAQPWIRRAVHAEAFAKALEEELERLRNPPIIG